MFSLYRVVYFGRQRIAEKNSSPADDSAFAQSLDASSVMSVSPASCSPTIAPEFSAIVLLYDVGEYVNPPSYLS